jgi:murein DD-endopeptidase MepM/ murein hydrolase activator NlpD
MNRMLRVTLALLLVAMLNLSAARGVSARQSRAAAPASLTVRWEPEQLVNGSPCLFRVTPAASLESLTGTWLEHKVFFNFDPATGTWYGVAGVGVDTPPGSYTLTLAGVTSNGERASLSQKVMVNKAVYQTIALRVPKQFTEPDAKTLERIQKEQALKQAVFKRVNEEREWSGRFTAPIHTPITEEFGTQRTFNRERQSLHQGLDYRANPGTPIAALNNGTVVLARELFFEGNCIMIDHGQGLMTLYFHLSEINVEEGGYVRGGQTIGLSGATGRVTGPHLHVAVRWQGFYLNPATMLKLELP